MHQESSNPTPSSGTPQDEIDIRTIFRFFGSFFLAIFNFLILTLVGFRKLTIQYRWWIIGTMLSATLLWSGYSSFIQRKTFQTTLILKSTYLNGPLLEKYIEKLNSSDDRSSLLNLDANLDSSIIQFWTEPFISEEEIINFELFKQRLLDKVSEADISNFIDRLSLENRSTYQIHMEMTEANIEALPIIEQALLAYLSENNYVRKRLEIEDRNWKAKKKKIQQDLVKLDSLQNIIFHNLANIGKANRKGSNNVILGEEQPIDPLSVFREDLRIYEQEQIIDKELFLRKNFELIDSFGTFNGSSQNMFSPAFWTKPLIYSAFLAYLFIFAIHFNKFLASKERENLADKQKPASSI